MPLLSRSQQGKMRPLQRRAWETQARRSGVPVNDRIAARAFWVSILQSACQSTEVKSSSDLTNPRQFERLMAKLEMIVGEGFFWQQALISGDLKRLRWRLSKTSKGAAWLLQFANDSALESYVCAMACQAFPHDFPEPPGFLYLVSDAHFFRLAQMVSVAVNRHA